MVGLFNLQTSQQSTTFILGRFQRRQQLIQRPRLVEPSIATMMTLMFEQL